jgi:hypothetical protein
LPFERLYAENQLSQRASGDGFGDGQSRAGYLVNPGNGEGTWTRGRNCLPLPGWHPAQTPDSAGGFEPAKTFSRDGGAIKIYSGFMRARAAEKGCSCSAEAGKRAELNGRSGQPRDERKIRADKNISIACYYN